MMTNRVSTPSLFESERMTFEDAVELSIASLNAYGDKYRHWAIAYSGGKDSSATAAFVTWAIRTGRVKAPETLTILYADTRQELTPLQAVAQDFMQTLRNQGFYAETVLPEMDNRFYVYMLGRGVPPPSNRFRWCTPKLKIEPMAHALQELRQQRGEKFLMLTGVRLGESARRDERIAISCSKDSGECGQGWFQSQPPEAVSDTLAPLLHWRVCYVWDWLFFGNDATYAKTKAWKDYQHGYDLARIAEVYGGDDVRTGCIGCNLASRDVALENLVKHPNWMHLTPLLEIKPLFAELKKPQNRVRKATPDIRKDGGFAKNGQRMGPLTMKAREYGLNRVLDIQSRAGVNLIDTEEEARIRELWALNTWPNGWEGAEIQADVPLDSIRVVDGELVVQKLLL